jgi:VRR-NUC domain
MTERDIQNDILREISRGDVRLFRQNAGFAWQGTVIEQTPTRLVLANPRPLKMGAPGMSDLGGWVTVDRIAVYTALEIKSARGRPTPEQLAFIDTVRRAGGRAGVARSVEDARKIIIG